MRLLGFPSAFLAAVLAAAPAVAQPCVGLPVEAGEQAVGATIETETGYTLLAGSYAGSSRALAWRAHAGAVTEEFPGSFPGEFGPAAGAGLAWVGASRAFCPAVGVDYFDEDPETFAVEPGDSDRDVTVLSLGWGAGFSTPPDSTRAFGAIVYVVPQVRWVRTARSFGEVEDSETDRQLAFEAGVTAFGRRLWAGGGARVRHREENDYPLDAVLLVRGGVRW
ncbi:MAG TPA: hypothetical protein VJ982_07770 [Gemmatimonadota bacterium]|nr:hypothetical protein [Gemmatimonadota bacterium]